MDNNFLTTQLLCDCAAAPLSLQVRIACLGPGTAKELKEALNLEADWVGQTALATEMAKDLPKDVGHVVMHPTSTAADEALKIGLEERGFRVNRFEVYDTRPIAVCSALTIYILDDVASC